MTREEQNVKSKEAIITAAIAEFGRHGYEGSSLNTALNEAGISKGKIYHYFESKDQVYLACVSACFDQLMERLQGEKDKDVRTLPDYFRIRWEFFEAYPSFAQIFFEAVERPPEHLREEIQQRKARFDEFNLSVFRAQLVGLKLRSGISEEDAIEYFQAFQEIFHRLMTTKFKDAPAQNVLELHEQELRKNLGILLYGIAKEETV
ncbi:TetR/AcrR family transcriptional regulator [Diplocloster hominis]|uniref:TetR/AcrR family transcriptional regulator n=1 Tax=Diplocloster hominis TaxID=3079010 RepID=UPI0031BA8027